MCTDNYIDELDCDELFNKLYDELGCNGLLFEIKQYIGEDEFNSLIYRIAKDNMLIDQDIFDGECEEDW